MSKQTDNEEMRVLMNMTHRVLIGTNLSRTVDDHRDEDTRRDEGPMVSINMSLRQARLLNAAFRRMHEIVG